MKKTFKKIVAAATTAALAFVGTVTFNPADAKADDNYYIVGAVFGNWSPADAPQMTAENDGTYSYSFDAAESKTYEFQILPTNTGWDGQIGPAAGGNFCGLALSAGTAKITFDPSKEGDARVTMTGLVAPNPAETYSVVGSMNGWDLAKGQAMTKNDDGTYTAVFDSIPADSYQFKVVQDGANYGWYASFGAETESGNAVNDEGVDWDGNEKLTVTFDPSTKTITSKAEQVEDDGEEGGEEGGEEVDPDATTVTVHVSTEWLKAKLYAFTTADSTPLAGAWPGSALKDNADNKGYVSLKITLDKTEDITVIVNGTTADKASAQTVNLPLTVKDGANEFWITTLDTKSDEADEFGNTNYLAEVSAEAPEGWVAGEVEEAEVEEETGDDETGDDETGDDENSASAWDDAKLKIHVKMPELENWDALGVYLFGSDENFGWSGSELSGAWPGAAMVLENDSETWYAFGGTFADGFYKLIVNNYVSDDEAAEGAIKCQIDPALDITDGEYWITIDLAEDGTYVATVMTEAPEDYDGTGLSDDQIAEDPTADDTDDATDDAADDDTTDDTTGANPASGSTDGLPVAGAMVVVMFSAAVVVASRKRRAA